MLPGRGISPSQQSPPQHARCAGSIAGALGERSLAVLRVTCVVVPLHRTKFDICSGWKSFPHHMEQSTQPPLMQTLPWTPRQNAAPSRAIQRRTHEIQCDCSLFPQSKSTCGLRPHSVPEPRRKDTEPVNLGTRSNHCVLVS